MNPDPNLTAWALNELSAEDRERLEATMKQNPDLRIEAKQIQDFCRFISSHLDDEQAALTDAQRSYITTATTPRRMVQFVSIVQEPIQSKPKRQRTEIDPWWRQPALLLPLSAAAVLVLGSLYYVREPVRDKKLAVSKPQTPASAPAPATRSITPAGADYSTLYDKQRNERQSATELAATDPTPTKGNLSGKLAESLAVNHPAESLNEDLQSQLGTMENRFNPLISDGATTTPRLNANGTLNVGVGESGALRMRAAGEKNVPLFATVPQATDTYFSDADTEGRTTRGFAIQGDIVVGENFTLTPDLPPSRTYTGVTDDLSFGVTAAGRVPTPAEPSGQIMVNRGTLHVTAADEVDFVGDMANRGGAVLGRSVTITSPGKEAKPVGGTAGATPIDAIIIDPATAPAAPDMAGIALVVGQQAAPTPALQPSPAPAPAAPAALPYASSLALSSPTGSARPEIDTLERSKAKLTADKPEEKKLAELDGRRLEDLRLLREEETVRQRVLERTPPAYEAPSGESYAPIVENQLTEASREPRSTFSVDVDTAAYAIVRRYLNNNTRPPRDAIRLEELINYFPYGYELPDREDQPFAVHVDVAEAPWQPSHRLARIGIKGREIGMERLPSNFVFLVDVSGSMNEPNKLPLVQQSLGLLTDQLGAEDRVSIVVYAGNSGLVLDPTRGDQKKTIRRAIDKMKAGGSTHGSEGIELAYEQAQKHFLKEGVNRVILCTDGDFNVGVTSTEALEKLITEKAKDGVFLSVLGYGTGNTKDTIMETLADKGNGNYAYIDSLSEARKVLVEQMQGTLVTIAKDVKIQVEFNPALVRAYRLIGYENRLLAKEDFNDDTKDAGEIGAGHTVTALYEIVPVDARTSAGRPLVDDFRYQTAVPKVELTEAAKSGEMMVVNLRYKAPDGDTSSLIEHPVRDEGRKLAESPHDFQFATAVAGFGLLLRDSAYKGAMTWDQVRGLAQAGKGPDPHGYRGEFLQLVDKARGVTGGDLR